VLTGALVTASSPESNSGATATPAIRLKTISSRVTSKGTSLVIEASEPVPYVATRPDPLTLLIDFRNVAADTVTRLVAPDAKSACVRRRRAGRDRGSASGLAGPRIRIKLSEPVGYRARAAEAHGCHRLRQVGEIGQKRARRRPYVLPPTTRGLQFRSGGRGSTLSRVNSTAVDPIAALGLNTSDAPRPRPGAAAADAQATQSGRVGAALPQTPPPAAQAPAPEPALPGVARAGERRFTGNPVSLDFQGADLRAVLRTFSKEINGLNIVIDPAVSGSVDVARDVPWDQALDIILRANKLSLVDGRSSGRSR
jgi:hypothetical protein